MQIKPHEGFSVVGLSERVRNDDPAAIGALWEAFHARNIRDEIGTEALNEVYCVYHGYDGGFLDPYRMTIGFRVPESLETPADLYRVKVPEQTFAVFMAEGPQPQTLISEWQAIWNGDHNRAYLADFDVYDANNPELVTVFVGLAE